MGKTAVAPIAQNNTATIGRITYSLAGQIVAVRVSGDPDPANNGLHYLYTDHLGGINAIQRQNGAVEQTRYYPFGAYRQGGRNPLTDQGYTGQRENMGDLGLMYYNARYYLPGAGRFLSADTIVPDPQNPQSLNRYAYTLNSPLNYTDPSGHCVQYATDDNMDAFTECMDAWNQLSQAYGRIARGGDASEYPNAYMNNLLETGTTEEILEMLETIGPAAERVQQAHLKEINSGCIPMQGGGLNCPPEGGWPEYALLPDGYWYIEIGIGPLVYDSSGSLESGLGPTVCVLECAGIEGSIDLTIDSDLLSSDDLSLNYKSIRGVGIGTNITIGDYNKHGLLVMLGESHKYNLTSSARIERSQFFLLNISPLFVEIGHRTIK